MKADKIIRSTMPNVSPSNLGNNNMPPQVRMRTSLPSSANPGSTYARRRSLNVSHFNALQNAVSNLARIDDFDLEELGFGFFSDVFKVTHKQTGKVLVLKRNKDTNSKMNILREVQLMNRLSHPNILKFKGVCVDDGQLHSLTEFINGGDLEQLVSKGKVNLSWKERLLIALDIARGLHYLHSLGVFHRDLSAKNCLIRITTSAPRNANLKAPGGEAKKRYRALVADLGLAEKIPASAEEEARLSMVGTPYIMAPEVLHGKPYNESVDIFAYGLLLCQLIALVTSDPEELPRSNDFGLAFDLFKRMVTVGSGAARDSSDQPVPPDFLQLAFDCCQFDPKSRPTIKQVVASLEAILVRLKKIKRASSFRVADAAIRSRYSTPAATGGSQSGSSPSCSPSKPRLRNRNRRTSSASRLSRSFSDISRELLAHAAIMASSSHASELLGEGSDDEGTFSNPFSTLEHLNGGRVKLVDEPSLALLEMTFDIATSEHLKSCHQFTEGSRSLPRRKHRPKSVFATFNQNPHPSSPGHQVMSLNLSSPAHTVRNLSSESLDSAPASNCTTPDGSTTTHPPSAASEEYKMALRRSMILSPRGNNLASWWCARKRADAEVSEDVERRSLASVMSVLARNMTCSVRRSISLPDISKISTLFHGHEKIGGLAPSSSAASSPRKSRSRTGDEVFYRSAEKQELVLTDAAENTPEQRPKSICVVVSDHSSVSSKSSGGHHVRFSTSEEANTPASEKGSSAANEIVVDQGAASDPTGCSDCGHPPEERTSASSSESSSTGILVAAAEITRRRRISAEAKGNEAGSRNFSNSNSNHTSVNHRPCNGVPDPSKLRNRDSGFEDDLHPSLLPSGNHHLVWSIDEDELPASEPTDSIYSSCSLGSKSGLDPDPNGGSLVTDWNCNHSDFVHSSKYNLRSSDAVL